MVRTWLGTLFEECTRTMSNQSGGDGRPGQQAREEYAASVHGYTCTRRANSHRGQEARPGMSTRRVYTGTPVHREANSQRGREEYTASVRGYTGTP
jgi:hypothetical protein